MNKYRSQKVVYNGITFDSKKEYKRYLELELLLKSGKISQLKRQVKYELLPSQRDQEGKVIERPCIYKADFEYFDNEANKWVTEDTKGYRTKDYLIKRKLMLYRFDIRIREV